MRPVTYFLNAPSVQFSGPMGSYSSPCQSLDDPNYLDPENLLGVKRRRKKREGDYVFDANFTSVDAGYDYDVRFILI